MVRPPADAICNLPVGWLRGGLGDLEKFHRRPVPKMGQNHKKYISPVLEAVLGETPANPNLIAQ